LGELTTPYGGEYILNEKLIIETQLVNIFGGEPFPAIVNIELTELRPADNYCKLEMQQNIDKEKGSEILYVMAEKIAAAAGKPITEDEEMPEMEISDDYEFEVELITGWLNRAYSKRTILAADVRQVDIYEIVLKN